MNLDKTEALEEEVEDTNKLKSMLVNYVGNKINPDDNKITVENIVDVMSEEFPEFLLAIAEENWIRGYHQALHDAEKGREIIEEHESKQEESND